MNVIGYNVYRAADGCSEEFYGFVETLDEARKLAEAGSSLPESLYATAEAAGHCGGLEAPDKTNEGEVAEWFGDDGYDCAVQVFIYEELEGE